LFSSDHRSYHGSATLGQVQTRGTKAGLGHTFNSVLGSSLWWGCQANGHSIGTLQISRSIFNRHYIASPVPRAALIHLVAMTSGASPPSLSSLADLDGDGASPWGDELSSSTPPITLPIDHENSFKFEHEDSHTTPAAEPSTVQGGDGEPTPTPAPAPKTRRTPRRPGRQVVRAEAISDDQGPLGPLGDASPESTTPLLQATARDVPPQPPVKEATPLAAGRGGVVSAAAAAARPGMRDALDNIGFGDEGEMRGQHGDGGGGVGGGGDGGSAEGQPAAAKPLFEIVVGDPHKVGDLTSAHTVYNVRTKVWL